MDKVNNELETVKQLKNVLKPKLYLPIWTTIICSGPPLNLIFRYFFEKDLKNPTILIALTILALVWITFNWYWYFKDRNDFKKSWDVISIELHTLNPLEKPSKDIIGTIFNISSAITIISLLMSLVFASIAVLSKLSFAKYLAVFSFLIFFISGGAAVIVAIIFLISFVRDLRKRGRFKKIFKKFVLIYAISFIILMIFSFIMHKNLQLIEYFLESLIITLPIVLYIEIFVLYKEMKNQVNLLNNYTDKDP